MGKQVVIQGKEDDWYEKAVFLLREEPPKGSINLVNEANYIIGSYMKTKNMENELHHIAVRQKAKWIDIFFYTTLLLLIITAIYYFLL